MIEGLEKLEAAAGEGSEASHLMESRIAYRYTALTQGQCSYVGCVTFRKPGEGSVPLTRCMQCHAVQYCGPGCEAVDWRHKMMCGVLAGSPSKKRAREEARDDEAMEGP